MAEPLPKHRAVVRMPCWANDKQVRAIHDEIAQVAGMPKIRVLSAFGNLEDADLEGLLTVPRWGRIQLISFKTADITVTLEDNPGRSAVIEWTEPRASTGARLKAMVRDCVKWWMLPCFGWAVALILFVAFLTWVELERREYDRQAEIRLTAEREEQAKRLEALKAKYGEAELQRLIDEARKRQPAKPVPASPQRSPFSPSGWVVLGVMVVLVGLIWPHALRALILMLVSPFLLFWLLGRLYRRLFPAFIFVFDSTPNAYPVRMFVSSIVTLGQIGGLVVTTINLVRLFS